MAARHIEQQATAAEVEALRRALARAEDQAIDLQDFLDNAVEGLHRVGPDGVIQWANRAELEMLGYQREEYVGQPLARFHADPAVAVDILKRLKAGEAVHNRQAVMVCRDGGHIFVLVSASAVFREGRFVGTRGFTRSLTDERDAYLAQERLAAIVGGSDDAIVSKDLDGTVRSWNRGAQALFGYTPEEMVGGSILRIIPPDRHGEERTIIARIAAGERVDHYETVRLHRDGHPIEVSLTVSPLTDISGRVIGASKIARDISVRREVEDARGVLASVVESADDAIISESLGGIVTSWNPAAERLYGYTREEMVGESVQRIIPLEMRDEEERILAEVRLGRRMEHYETTRVAQGGRRMSVSLTVSPVRDGSGRVVGASKIARDIGAQRAAERAQAVLAAIVHSSDDAIISKGLDSVVTSWNPAAERLYGYSAKEMVGRPILTIIPPELRSEEDYILAEIRAGRRITHLETERLRKDGSRVQVSLTVSPVLGPDGTIVGASKIARDVSAQREAQRKKDQFLAVLAHELRNPLAPIRNTLALVRDGTLAPGHRERAVGMAERQMLHLTRLLDDLLDASRMASGRVELRRERVDLTAIARQAAEAVLPHLEGRRHNFTAHISPEPLWLDADAVRIGQVMGNLLTNASKYTDPGGNVELVVKREGNWASIRVRDDGIGFSPQMRDRLFNLFEQEEDATLRAAGGLGIGLALVREFVERHGGSVDAASDGPGCGSTFSVRLPLVG